jgi:hypothetical protein
MKNYILIWVDDERQIPKWAKDSYDVIKICRTFREAIAYLDKIRNKEIEGCFTLDLDHDLGCKGTGYDIAKYIVANDIPIDFCRCHSMNPVGRKNIEDLLIHYGYHVSR